MYTKLKRNGLGQEIGLKYLPPVAFRQQEVEDFTWAVLGNPGRFCCW